MKKIALFSAIVALNPPLIALADKPLPPPLSNRSAEEAQGWEKINKMIQEAEKGNLDAQKNLIFMYLMVAGNASDEEIKQSGLAASIPEAVDKAVFWMRKLAEQGDVSYQSRLGTYYMGDWKFGSHGEFKTTHNFEEAAKWYKLAADQGDAPAQNNLGGLYLEGHGVQKDVVQAYKWYYLASQQNPQIYRNNLSRAAETMNASQITEAEGLATEWLKNHDKAKHEKP